MAVRANYRGKVRITPEASRQCLLCHEPYQSRPGVPTAGVCQSCSCSKHRFKMKYWMIRYKGGCCQLCGYKRCLRSLDFHHVDPKTKRFSVSSRFCCSWEELKKEMNKCVCLCRNCHGEVEEEMDLWKRWGHKKGSLLRQVDMVHKRWKPPTDLPPFRRTNWEVYHPKFWCLKMPIDPPDETIPEPDDNFSI
jgi:hypothetical protein